MIKVIIADDQTVVREGIKYIIQQDPMIEVVGCAGDGREALALCGEFLPDIVLMDIKMPECDGVEGTRLIKERYPQIKVLMITTYSDDENVSKAMVSGADGYILKDIEPNELKNTIKSTVNGLRVIHQRVFDTLIKHYHTGVETVKQQQKNIDIALTEREKSIIQLIVFGKSNKEIATVLHISEGRVRNIMTGILEKLGLKDRTQLAVFAVKNNWV